jgi:hypothetical protein
VRGGAFGDLTEPGKTKKGDRMVALFLHPAALLRGRLLRHPAFVPGCGVLVDQSLAGDPRLQSANRDSLWNAETAKSPISSMLGRAMRGLFLHDVVGSYFLDPVGAAFVQSAMRETYDLCTTP